MSTRQNESYKSHGTGSNQRDTTTGTCVVLQHSQVCCSLGGGVHLRLT